MTNRVWAFIRGEKYFAFEAYLLVRITGFGISFFTVGLLIQDKVCINVYHESADFCQHIYEEDSVRNLVHTKDLILATTAQFSNYRNLIRAIPMIPWFLFVGSFLDRYPGATLLLFLLGNLFDQIAIVFFIINAYFFSLSPYYLLLSSILAFFTGDMISFLTTANRYIIIHTDEQQRATKFVLFQSVLSISYALSTFVGGHLLVLQHNDSQLRTYCLCFIVSSVMNIVSIVLLFMLKWEIPRERSTEAVIINQNAQDEDDTEDETPRQTNSNHNLIETNQSASSKRCNLLKTLFSLKNFKDSFHCLTRQRPGHQRTQIFLLNSIILISFFIDAGIDDTFMQFTEKAYHWSSQTYSTVKPLANLTVNAVMLLLSYLLITQMNISDGALIVNTIPFGVIAFLLIGTFLNPIVFLVTIPFKAVSGLSSVMVKSKLSKIITNDEAGKIFSLISTMEAIMPFIGSFVFIQIFSATVSTYPGMIYQACGAFSLIALVIAVVLELYYC